MSDRFERQIDRRLANVERAMRNINRRLAAILIALEKDDIQDAEVEEVIEKVGELSDEIPKS